MKEGNGFMSDMSHEDAKLILTKLDDLDKDFNDLRLSLQETSGQMKGNTELVKMEIEHMKREQVLKEEKLEAQITLINNEVQRNKDSISSLYDKDREHDSITTKINVLFVILGLLALPIGYGVIQIILLWGKVKGF